MSIDNYSYVANAPIVATQSPVDTNAWMGLGQVAEKRKSDVLDAVSAALPYKAVPGSIHETNLNAANQKVHDLVSEASTTANLYDPMIGQDIIRRYRKIAGDPTLKIGDDNYKTWIETKKNRGEQMNSGKYHPDNWWSLDAEHNAYAQTGSMSLTDETGQQNDLLNHRLSGPDRKASVDVNGEVKKLMDLHANKNDSIGQFFNVYGKTGYSGISTADNDARAKQILGELSSSDAGEQLYNRYQRLLHGQGNDAENDTMYGLPNAKTGKREPIKNFNDYVVNFAATQGRQQVYSEIDKTDKVKAMNDGLGAKPVPVTAEPTTIIPAAGQTSQWRDSKYKNMWNTPSAAYQAYQGDLDSQVRAKNDEIKKVTGLDYNDIKSSMMAGIKLSDILVGKGKTKDGKPMAPVSGIINLPGLGRGSNSQQIEKLISERETLDSDVKNANEHLMSLKTKVATNNSTYDQELESEPVNSFTPVEQSIPRGTGGDDMIKTPTGPRSTAALKLETQILPALWPTLSFKKADSSDEATIGDAPRGTIKVQTVVIGKDGLPQIKASVTEPKGIASATTTNYLIGNAKPEAVDMIADDYRVQATNYAYKIAHATPQENVAQMTKEMNNEISAAQNIEKANVTGYLNTRLDLVHAGGQPIQFDLGGVGAHGQVLSVTGDGESFTVNNLPPEYAGMTRQELADYIALVVDDYKTKHK